MKLFELTGIKHLKNLSALNIVKRLGALNKEGKTKLKWLGNGANGVALTNGETVFKFWHRDSAYEKYVIFCMENPDNPYLPKFKSKIRKLPIAITSNHNGEELEGVRYVKMEMLSKLYDNDTTIQLLKDGDILGDNNHMSVESIIKLVGSHKPFEKYHKVAKYTDPDLIEFIRTITWVDDLDITMDDVTDEFRYLLETIKGIVKLVGSTDNFDLHSGNLMCRGDQIVILDPISNSDDIRLNDTILKMQYMDYQWMDGYREANSPEQAKRIEADMDDIMAELEAWDELLK